MDLPHIKAALTLYRSMSQLVGLFTAPTLTSSHLCYPTLSSPCPTSRVPSSSCGSTPVLVTWEEGTAVTPTFSGKPEAQGLTDKRIPHRTRTLPWRLWGLGQPCQASPLPLLPLHL